MGVYRMQKGSASDAVCATALVASRESWAGIATDDIVTGAAGIVRIINSEFRVIKDVESLNPKLNLTAFGDPKMLGQSHIEVNLSRVIQKISTGVAESKSPGSYKLRRVLKQRSKTLRGIKTWDRLNWSWFSKSFHYIRIGRGDPEVTADPGIVSEGNTGIADRVDNAEWCARVQQRYTREFPALQNSL